MQLSVYMLTVYNYAIWNMLRKASKYLNTQGVASAKSLLYSCCVRDADFGQITTNVT